MVAFSDLNISLSCRKCDGTVPKYAKEQTK
jgi:hypothetical protein